MNKDNYRSWLTLMFLNGDPNKLQNGYKVKTIFNKFDIYYIIDKRPWESFCVKCTCRFKYTAIKIFGVQDELRHVMLLLLAKPTFRCFQEQNKVENMKRYI